MAYPRENLAPGETVLVHRHPHWKSLVAPVLLFWLLTAVAGLLLGLLWNSAGPGPARTWATVAVGVVWGLGAFWWLARPLAAWATTHFVVTDRRVIYRNGILTRSGIDIPIGRINTVEFSHGLLDRILRTGSLQIQSASDDPLTFVAIPRVESVHALLYERLLDHVDDEDWDRRSDWDRRGDGDRRGDRDRRDGDRSRR
ncbi:PH domain-containing protein [Gordonia sp. PP30]|uniref:PH domain-containing protein n=1 Tax=unclassified Gordonia (in: high G+C Gram-positive bacteria) TaxID=2657482 RepID=UPI001FFF5298|nr:MULTISPECIES: PH domain-containing protein [unclassified Gordonia (in: high G+C Gram-positive bacteria)]UQE76264.1 PH domain-containing protein [Gordonia sp. PP30]